MAKMKCSPTQQPQIQLSMSCHYLPFHWKDYIIDSVATQLTRPSERFKVLVLFGSKLFTLKSSGKIFPPLKLHCYSWPRCGSLTFAAINRTTGYRFWLICISCMWFHFMIGQNGIRKNTLLLSKLSLPDPRLYMCRKNTL